jgi:DNA polymerase III subunit epsilon
MFLILDTETTNFISKDLPASHRQQAHACQVAMLLLDDNFQEADFFYSLVHPEDRWDISEGAQKCHGISLFDCQDNGIPISHVLDQYRIWHNKSTHLVCHNLKFDHKIMSIELEASQFAWKPQEINYVCTMEAMTSIMKLPHKRVNAFGKQYKWPTLAEAYSCVTRGGTILGAHDALVDVRATAKVFQYLVENKHIIIVSDNLGMKTASIALASK